MKNATKATLIHVNLQDHIEDALTGLDELKPKPAKRGKNHNLDKDAARQHLKAKCLGLRLAGLRVIDRDDNDYLRRRKDPFKLDALSQAIR
eukprot:3447886-Rhodomonas_salina.1